MPDFASFRYKKKKSQYFYLFGKDFQFHLGKERIIIRKISIIILIKIAKFPMKEVLYLLLLKVLPSA